MALNIPWVDYHAHSAVTSMHSAQALPPGTTARVSLAYFSTKLERTLKKQTTIQPSFVHGRIALRHKGYLLGRFYPRSIMSHFSKNHKFL